MRELWSKMAAEGGFDLAGTRWWPKVQASGIVSGHSTHADRLATIREVATRYGLVIDPHTADGVKVGLEHRDPAAPLICVETALAPNFRRRSAKPSAAIRRARPPGVASRRGRSAARRFPLIRSA